MPLKLYRFADVCPVFYRAVKGQSILNKMAGLLQKGLCFNTLVLWNNGADLDPEMLYAESVPVGNGVHC